MRARQPKVDELPENLPARDRLQTGKKSFVKIIVPGPTERIVGLRGPGQIVGEIEVSPGWVPGEWNVDEVIEGADLVGGFRFAKLENVLSYKKSLRREKDIPDIFAIEAYIKRYQRQAG